MKMQTKISNIEFLYKQTLRIIQRIINARNKEICIKYFSVILYIYSRQEKKDILLIILQKMIISRN